ncbi:MAG TPA: L,D-transpeptidase family protein [Gaiellaceae bacterium]|nr:L,D-transpeptidase family protein [Gaiellaceae bacterium]
MRRTLLVLCVALLALAAAPPALAQDPPPDPEPTIALGVTVSGVDVSGMTAAEAEAALQAFFAQPLAFSLRGVTGAARPIRLGARARLVTAAAEALAAPEGEALTLGVSITRSTLKAWVAKRAKSFNRKPVSTRVRLVGLTPRLTKARQGRALVRKEARLRLIAALKAHSRTVALPVKRSKPEVTPRKFGPAVVIRRESKRLTLYRPKGAGPMRAVVSYPIATGMAAYPTPLGSFRIVTKQRNPWWYPPSAGWAAGAKPIPPGPGNPLGTRWMGLSVGAVGIHGTPDAASIGYSASHGCIRMRIPDAERLFERVRVGTPVFVVRA